MKTTFRAAAAALVILGTAWSGAAAQAAAATTKIAFIDSNVILADAPGTAEAKKMIENEMGILRAMVNRWQDTLLAKRKAFTDAEATLSPAVRLSRQKELDDLGDTYQKRSDSLQQVAQNRQREIMQPILEMVNRVLADLRNSEGYSVILDIGAGSPVVVAYDRNLDITERVLGLVKKLPAPALPAPGSAKAGAPATNPAGVKKPPPPLG